MPDPKLMEPVFVTGVGAISSVGFTAETTTTSVHAGVSRMQELSIPARRRRPLVGAPVTGFADKEVREYRLWRMLEEAATQALEQADEGRQPLLRSRCLFLLNKPEVERPGYSVDFARRAEIQERLGFSSDRAFWRECHLGSSGPLSLVHDAALALAAGLADSCIVGSVDTLIQLRTLRWLEDTDRLKTEAYTDGVIPGEGAAFFVLESARALSERGVEPLASIQGIGCAHSDANVLNGQALTGEALTCAIRKALANANCCLEGVREVYADLNGESYRAREWALASVRLNLSDSATLRHPADCIGDLGACTGAMLVCVAATPVSDQTGPKLLFTVSEAGHRVALVVKQEAKTKSKQSSAGRSCQMSADLAEEHLDEFRFNLQQRDRVIDSPDHNLRYLRKIDARIDSHLKGLSVLRSQCVDLCAEALAAEDSAEQMAAACLLLRFGKLDLQRDLLERYLADHYLENGFLSRALHFSEAGCSIDQLKDSLGSSNSYRVAAACELLAFHGLSCPDARLVEILLKDSDPAVRALAWATASHCRIHVDHKYFMDEDSPLSWCEIARAAIATQQEWFLDQCRARFNGDSRDARYWTATLDGEAAFELIMELASSTPRSTEWSRLIAAYGHPATVPALLEQMRSANVVTAVTAGKAFTAITGFKAVSKTRVPIIDSAAVPDEFEAEFIDDDWLPDPDAAAGFWRTAADHFQNGKRWRLGVNVSSATAHSLSDHLDLEGRLQTYLRASYFGAWRGNIADLSKYPQSR